MDSVLSVVEFRYSLFTANNATNNSYHESNANLIPGLELCSLTWIDLLFVQWISYIDSRGKVKLREVIRGKIKHVLYIWKLPKEMIVEFVNMNIITEEGCTWWEKRADN